MSDQYGIEQGDSGNRDTDLPAAVTELRQVARNQQCGKRSTFPLTTDLFQN